MTASLLCAILAALPLGGAVDLAGSRGRPQSSDVSERVLFGLEWRAPIVRTGFERRVNASFGEPAVSERAHLVIVGSGEGDVRAFHLRAAKPAWTYAHGAAFETAVSLFDVGEGASAMELAILGSRDGKLLALESATGRLVWQTDVEGDVRAAASRAGALVVVATTQNRVVALELATGKIVWSAGRPPPTGLTIVGHARPLVDGGTVYAAFSDGYVEAYGAGDGARRWSRPISLKGGEFVDADADPVIAKGRLFVASYSDGIFALDPKDGQTIWTRPAAAVNRLALYDDQVLAASGDGFVWGLAQADGAPLHRTQLPHGLVSRMEVRDNLVVLAGGETGLVVLRADNGQPLQATGLPTRLSGDPTWSGNRVSVLSADGYLYSFVRGHRGTVQ